MRKMIEILNALYVQVSGLEFYKYIGLFTGIIVVAAVIICLCRKRGQKSGQTDARAMDLNIEKAPEIIPESEPNEEDWRDIFTEIEAELALLSRQKKNTEVIAENESSVDVWSDDFEDIDLEFDSFLNQMGETQDLEVSTEEIYRYGETQE